MASQHNVKGIKVPRRGQKATKGKVSENYFLVFGTQLEDKERIKERLSDIGYQPNNPHLYFWPEVLVLCPINNGMMPSVHIEILQALSSKSSKKVENILKPNDAMCKKWNQTTRTENINDLVKDAKNKCKAFHYMEGNDTTSSILLVRIDSEIDQNGKIRKAIKALLKEKTEYNQNSMLDYFEPIEPPGEDTEPVKEDEGELPEVYNDSEIIERTPEPAYYPSQIALANQIVERIKLIYKYYHIDRNFSDFTNFDFCIYTANANMLEGQTCFRLSQKDSECFPERLYEGSDIRARKKAKEKVHKYNKQTVENFHHDLCNKVKNEPNTLFLIVADEAHWGATLSDKANSTLVNNWNIEEHPNVIVLLVTATPYNLLTENTRLPDMLYRYEGNGELKFQSAQEIVRGTNCKDFKMLHYLKWTESLNNKVQNGIIVKLRVPLGGRDKCPAQLYVKPPETPNDDFLPWHGFMLTHEYPDYICEYLIQGEENHVTVTTVDKKWVLVVKGNEVGFINENTLNTTDISKFGMLVGYGEGLFILKVPGAHNREQYLIYKEESKRIELSSSRITSEIKLYDVPPLDSSLLIEQCRPAQSVGAVKEYISLNYYMNSMRNEKPEDQLIKEDLYLQAMEKKIMKTVGNLSITIDGILTAEYSYYIILINLFRKCPLKVSSISECFENLYECAGNYPKLRMEKVRELKNSLEQNKIENSKSKADICSIEPLVFDKVLSFLSDKVLKDFNNDLKGFNRRCTEETGKELLRSIVTCLMHLNIDDLKKVQDMLSEEDNCKSKLTAIYENSKDMKFEEIVNEILLTSETGHIVDSLIPKDVKKLDGNMKIIRVNSVKDGNSMYKTLCIARKISSDVDYSFEILRDYDKANFSDDFSDKLEPDKMEQSRRYRIRLRLQPKKCTFIDPQTYASCHCMFKGNKSTELLKPSMECKTCGHVHKKIETYVDVNGLPCILIIIQKGRLGDTFPQSFDVMDLRLCNREKRQLTLASIVQELGRLCRYQKKSQGKPLPYALVGKHLADVIRKSLVDGATYYGLVKLSNGAVQLDRKTIYKNRNQKDILYAENVNTSEIIHKANKSHFDHGNTEKHNNRLLFEAEPQIGKTGVYLKTIAMLRQQIRPDPLSESDSEDDDIEDEDSEKGEETNKIFDWVYPFWKDLEMGPKLKKNSNTGKYRRLYGNYQYGNNPPEVIKFGIFNQKTTRTKKQKGIRTASAEDEPKAYNFKEHSSCVECSVQYENVVLDVCLPRKGRDSEEQIKLKISVPKTLQFNELLNCMKPYMITKFSNLFTEEESNTIFEDSERHLKSWIFIPSYHRHDRANVNLYHTMVSRKDSNNKLCQYISVLVVRSTDFQSYCQLWQSTHAILQIPDSLPREDRNVDEGGIGFARLVIQIFAESLGLPWIFMLDDNIPYAYEITERNSVVQRENGQLTEVKVPLFKVLKHIEKQIDGSERKAPIQEFERYTEISIEHPLEEYTGVKNKYGIIGVKKHSATSRRVNTPFAKTHVYSLALLNISMLQHKNIHYNPWPVFEDLTLNNECDDQNLWVCKYNRFSIWKHHMRTWIPKVFTWSENTVLRKAEEDADNSTDILISYLKSMFPIKLVIELPERVFVEERRDEFQKMLFKLRQLNGKHQLWAIRDHDFEKSTEKLREYYKVSDRLTSENNYIILMMTSDLCIEKEMTTKFLIEAWLQKIIEENFDCTVFTSHNIGFFNVKIILVLVEVHIQPSTSTSQKRLPVGSRTPKKRRSDENEDGSRKSMKKNAEQTESNAATANASEKQTLIDQMIKQMENMDVEALRKLQENLPK